MKSQIISAWVAYMILSIVFWWWWEFNLQHIKVWTFPIYLFVIFYAFYLYLISAVLFPRIWRDMRVTRNISWPGGDGFSDC